MYRHPSLYDFADSLGWPQGYMDREDLESERLFDYGLLAPRPFTDPGGCALIRTRENWDEGLWHMTVIQGSSHRNSWACVCMPR